MAFHRLLSVQISQVTVLMGRRSSPGIRLRVEKSPIHPNMFMETARATMA
jgi:hypothetical protein